MIRKTIQSYQHELCNFIFLKKKFTWGKKSCECLKGFFVEKMEQSCHIYEEKKLICQI
jgi:hypothetical protein